MNDPLGLDLDTNEMNDELDTENESVTLLDEAEAENPVQTMESVVTNQHPHIVVTEAKLKLQGPRQLISILKPRVSIIKMVIVSLRSERLR